jgi:hypothetical protein
VHFAVAFATHGVTFHLWAALRYREYSPGLVTSTLYWLLVYLIGRHIHETGEPTSQVWTGVISGIIGGVVLSLSPNRHFSPVAQQAGYLSPFVARLCRQQHPKGTATIWG